MKHGLKTLLALLLISNGATAQDWTASRAMRAIETPSHQRLMNVVTNERADFTTDGCSGGLSKVWTTVANQFPKFAAAHQSKPPWENCCVTHDRAYHAAGDALDATASFNARLNADLALKSCVVSTAAARADDLAALYDLSPDQTRRIYAGFSETMYLAVRIGGAPCSGLPWRWGYGSAHCTVFSGFLD